MVNKAKRFQDVAKYLLIVAADGSETRTPFTGKGPTYQQLRDAVGNIIQPVSVFWQGKTRQAYVDEEGLLRGLPINERATEAWRKWGERTRHAVGDMFLVGKCVIVMREKVAS